jgi:hypothetical protein
LDFLDVNDNRELCGLVLALNNTENASTQHLLLLLVIKTAVKARSDRNNSKDNPIMPIMSSADFQFLFRCDFFWTLTTESGI